jgi:hypothetical protein
MDEYEFYLQIWRGIFVVCAVGIVTMGGCTSYESKRIADAIAAGASPMAAKCAIASNGSQNSNCLIIAAKP